MRMKTVFIRRRPHEPPERKLRHMLENQRVRLSKQLLQAKPDQICSTKNPSTSSRCARSATARRSTAPPSTNTMAASTTCFNEMEQEVLEHDGPPYLRAAPSIHGGRSCPKSRSWWRLFADENAPLCRVIINHNVDPVVPEALVDLPLPARVDRRAGSAT